VPALTPDTVPLELTVATAELPLIHVPPVVASVNEIVVPEHIVNVVEEVMVPAPVMTLTDVES